MVKVNLQGYKLIPITRENYLGVWEVYESNPEYFRATKGRVATPDDILDTFERIVEGYNPEKQYFVGLWQRGRPAAVLELLPDFPEEGVLWFSELIVRGDLQGRGVGPGVRIVRAVIASAANFKTIRLGTYAHLVPYWERHGFTQIPSEGGYIEMQLEL